jgi:class 3 adenylate cyclase
MAVTASDISHRDLKRADALAMSSSLAETCEQIEALEARGDFLQAYDEATGALALFPGDARLGYLAVRALARSGATRRARELYQQFDLGSHKDADFLALRARIEKDAAFASGGASRAARFAVAGNLYEGIYRAFGGHYPAVNAATMFLLSGETGRAHALARQALSTAESTGTEIARYWSLASAAEAWLVLARSDEAAKVLAEMAPLARRDLAARAATRRQLRHVIEVNRLDSALLLPLAPPRSVHYCGHMLVPAAFPAGRVAAAEAEIARAIDAMLNGLEVVSAFGSLACGSDILFAEAFLSRGIPFHLVLPFETGEFKTLSVAPGGEAWLARFDHLWPRAASRTIASRDGHLGDDIVFTHGEALAMGKAILRAQHIDGEALQIAVWDGRPPTGPAGAAADVAIWRATGRETRVIPVERSGTSALPQSDVNASEPGRREPRAILFGDTVGFGRLPGRLARRYREVVLGGIAETLRDYEVLAANSWGDAIYLVLSNAAQGAQCALAIQKRVRAIDFAALGFPEPLNLRISVHFGPAFLGRDELTGAQTYFGTEVTFAARMEPVTPPGEVYATEQLASHLMLEPGGRVTAEYVGSVALAKNYGAAPMYLLRILDP